MARSSWVNQESMGHVLAALMPTNRLIMRVCLRTGLRISDVLTLKTAKLASRMTVREAKTGKTRRVCIPTDLLHEMQEQAGRVWVFEGRCDTLKHRTRQAVYKDVKRAAAVFSRTGAIPPGAQVSPHSARKIAAVEAYQAGGLTAARKMLNHAESDPEVTLLYALADQIEPGKGRRSRKRRSNGTHR